LETECYPISVLPHASRIFLDYTEHETPLAPFYPVSPRSSAWMRHAGFADDAARPALADMLTEQSVQFGAGRATLANIELLRSGARAVVTGQQVGLFGGPLYMLLKAATVIQRAAQATAQGYPSVPVFWMATEDHDFAEVDHVALAGKQGIRHVQLRPSERPVGTPVGSRILGDEVLDALAEAESILGPGPFLEQLRMWYRPDATFAQAFGKLVANVFAPWGLIVMDASTAGFHHLGQEVLRRAIVDADRLHQRLLERNAELTAAGYHAQVLVAEGSSLLFLIDERTGMRLPLRRSEGAWKAGKRVFKEAELLQILKVSPERCSPNALLRSVFQDRILPTAAYIGGPAEIAYFAQSEVLYRELFGGATPILPRLSATLVEPAIASIMERHQISLTQAFEPLPELAARLGARAMPIAGKRRLARAGKALDEELEAVNRWMESLDEGLGRSARTASSKMRYQMNRLRRIAAHHQLEKDASLLRHATAISTSLFPCGHLQERTVGGAYFLAKYGDSLVPMLVQAAADPCIGHRVLPL
jgi:bacillithiol synthase